MVKEVMEEDEKLKGKWRRTQFGRMAGNEWRMNETVLWREEGCVTKRKRAEAEKPEGDEEEKGRDRHEDED